MAIQEGTESDPAFGLPLGGGGAPPANNPDDTPGDPDGTLPSESVTTIGARGTLETQGDGEPTYPCSLSSDWVVVIGTGGIADADNGGSDITDPLTQITATSPTKRRIVRRQNLRGTLLVSRLRYTDAITTAPVLQVFGRKDKTQQWERLPNKGGSIDIELSTDAADVGQNINGVRNEVTTVNATNHVVDTLGNNEFLTLVKTAALGDGAAMAAVEQKLV